MIESTLRRTTSAKPEDFDKRKSGLLAKLLPYLEQQPGFVSHELTAGDTAGSMVEVTRWNTEADCRAYLRGGAAAIAATWSDAFFPTAPYPNGIWLRETVGA